MIETVQTKNGMYQPAQVRTILEIYRTLFPLEEITPALRNYWDWARVRPWSRLTTDFHAATPEKLLALHQESLEIEGRYRAGKITDEQRAGELVAASDTLGVGYSIGVNPWTDNLLLRTFTPEVAGVPRHLVVVVGHDWYPIGAGADPETPMLDQGLHWTKKYHGPCPQAFFEDDQDRPVVFFLNLYPDFRAPGKSKMGELKERDQALRYDDCVAGLQEMLRILAPKFTKVSVISWGGVVWDHMRPIALPAGQTLGVKKHAIANPGMVLTFAGHSYLPISHPSMPNQVKDHLRVGFKALGLGSPMFDVKRTHA